MAQLVLVASITWLAVVSPGPDFVMIARNSALYGRLAGVAASLGIATGVLVHVAFAVFGLELVETHAPGVLDVVQIAGAVFLVLIGLRTMRSGPLVDSPPDGGRTVRLAASFGTGFATNALNYKTFLFVVALFSQVLGTETTFGAQLLVGGFVSVSHFVWFAFVSVFLTSAIARGFVVRYAATINRVLGTALTALGLLVAARWLVG